jgi:hypothetical protein
LTKELRQDYTILVRVTNWTFKLVRRLALIKLF